MDEFVYGLAYGGLGGLVAGAAGYLKALKEDEKQVFDPVKFGATIIVSAVAGAVYVFAGGVPDIYTTPALGGFVEVVLNRFGLKFKK